MEGKYPKRKRDKFNPYWIYEVKGQAFLEFRDSQEHLRSFAISRERYEPFDQFERENVAYMNHLKPHRDESGLTGELYEARQAVQSDRMEEIVFRRIRAEALHKAITIENPVKSTVKPLKKFFSTFFEKPATIAPPRCEFTYVGVLRRFLPERARNERLYR